MRATMKRVKMRRTKWRDGAAGQCEYECKTSMSTNETHTETQDDAQTNTTDQMSTRCTAPLAKKNFPRRTDHRDALEFEL